MKSKPVAVISLNIGSAKRAAARVRELFSDRGRIKRWMLELERDLADDRQRWKGEK